MFKIFSRSQVMSKNSTFCVIKWTMARDVVYMVRMVAKNIIFICVKCNNFRIRYRYISKEQKLICRSHISRWLRQLAARRKRGVLHNKGGHDYDEKKSNMDRGTGTFDGASG